MPMGSGAIGLRYIVGIVFIASGILIAGIAIESAWADRSDFRIDIDLISRILIGALSIYGGRRFMLQARVSGTEQGEYEKGHSTAQGIVLKRFEEVRSMGRDNDITIYTVVIQFDTKAGPYTLRADVPKRLFRSTSPEETIKVRYADSDPTIALLEGEW